MKIKLFCIVVFCLLQLDVHAQGEVTAITVEAGDNQGLIDAVNAANAGTGQYLVTLVPNADGDTEFVFDMPIPGTQNALPVITSRLYIETPDSSSQSITLRTSDAMIGEFRLAEVAGDAEFYLSRINVERFGVTMGNGGALLVRDQASLQLGICNFRNNRASGNGGAIAFTDNSIGEIFGGGEFRANRAMANGGAMTIEGDSSVVVFKILFDENSAGVFGCEINVNSTGNAFPNSQNALELIFSSLLSPCTNVLVENPIGKIGLRGNTLSHPNNGIDSTASARLIGNIFDIGSNTPGLQSASLKKSKLPPSTEAGCNDFGSGAFQSEGYNLSTDDSCALNQDTDLPNTNPMLTSQDGYLVPQAGSPVIDAGSTELYIDAPGSLASLPCGYADALGTASPQDGNSDGEFECDMGAIETLGTGSVTPGHSGAFFNALRNGEGNYVEILSPSVAVVYTFTYRPDGSGPAWFLGVGDIRDNSIVIDDLLRPIGTPFGDDFNADEIEFSEAGGMSMIFPTCDATDESGRVAYSGDGDLGYEGLLSLATRITSIAGCNVTPTPNAGLSGSFFDPARNGEGLIIEWLTSGDVVAIFFTFDPDGNQFWTFGVGTPVGKSVTINAMYPASSTSWGREFDPNEVDLQSWGTFDLNWTSCNDLSFDYNSSIPGFGSNSRSYSRISALQDTSCPDF